jgi:hypothetical protein
VGRRILFKLVAASAVGLALLGRAGPARASACCGEGHGIGQRLTSAERAAVTTVARFQGRIGAWTSDAEFAPLEGGSHDRELRLDAAWIVRVGEFEVGAMIPLVYTWRELGDASSSGGGVGDVQGFGRYPIIPVEGRGWLPGIALTLSAIAPTGRPPSEADDTLGAEATGIGVAEVRPGITLEKTWISGWFVAVAGSVGLRTASYAAGARVQSAPRWQVLAAAGPSWPSGFSFALGALFEADAGTSFDGQSTDDPRRRTAALAFAAYDIDDRWTVVGALQSDLPIDALGQRETVSTAGSLGLRFAWGQEN